MRSFFSQLLAAMLAIPLLIIILAIVFGTIGVINQPTVPDATVLKIDLREALPDRGQSNPFAQGNQPTANSIVGVVRALAQAENDDRVKGMYIRVGGAGFPVAHAQELREAMASFQAKGKFVLAHTQSIFSTGLGSYYLAAGADEFWMQPDGVILSSGVGISSLFMKQLLDTYGVQADFRGYKEYKTAAHGFQYEDYTEPMREARTELIQSIYDVAMGEMAQDRDLSVAQLTGHFDNIPAIGQDAVDRGLVDQLGYEVDARDAALDKAGDDAEFLSIGGYLQRLGPSVARASDPVIALVHGDGPINEGPSDETSPFGGSNTIGGDTLSEALRKATEDEDVQAIVFRVNSPGGSAIASEQIRYAVTKAQEAGKPVVISMGNVAASGGYWVSMTADHIVAQPATITGSIGVILGKFVVKDLFTMVGLNESELEVGEDAFLFSAQRPFSDEEWERLDRSLKAIYDEFTGLVAAGRDMSAEEVEDYARGRIWTGADAQERGLVDSLGGLRTAIAKARELAEIEDDANVRIREFPKPPGLEDILEDVFGASVAVARVGHTLDALLSRPEIVSITRTQELVNHNGVIAVEPVEAAH